MQGLIFAWGALSFFGPFCIGLWALFASNDLKGWDRVVKATTDPAGTRLRATSFALEGGPLHTPHGGAECCWFAVWAEESHSQGVGSDSTSVTSVAVFERSTAPIGVMLEDGTRVVLDPTTTWIEPGPGQRSYQTSAALPFGAAVEHRGLASMPRTRSWATFAAEGNVVTPAVGEVWLEPGALLDVYGVVAYTAEGWPTLTPVPAAGGVVALRAGGGAAELAVAKVAVIGRRKRLRIRALLAFMVNFVCFLAVALLYAN